MSIDPAAVTAIDTHGHIEADGEPPTEADIRGHPAGRLARDKIPRSFRFTETLPRNASGKLLRHPLRAQADDAASPQESTAQ
jgi:acyl-CoA synthetase (AMP-forming)/AMP-acid ligase II